MDETGLGLRGAFTVVSRTVSYGLGSLYRSPLAVAFLLIPASAITLFLYARTWPLVPGFDDVTPAIALFLMAAAAALLILYGFVVTYLGEGRENAEGTPRLLRAARRFALLAPAALVMGVIILAVSVGAVSLLARFMELMVPDRARALFGTGLTGHLADSVLLGAVLVPAAPLISPFLLGYHSAMHEGTRNPVEGVAAGFRLFRGIRWYPSVILAGVMVLAANGYYWSLYFGELLASSGTLLAPAAVVAVVLACAIIVVGAGCFEWVCLYTSRLEEMERVGRLRLPAPERARRIAIGFLLFAAPFVSVWGYHRTRSMLFVPLLAAACLVLIALAIGAPGPSASTTFDTKKVRRAAIIKLSWPCVLLVAFMGYAALNQNWRHLPGYALILAILLFMVVLAYLHYRRVPGKTEQRRDASDGPTTIVGRCGPARHPAPPAGQA